jgi:beta-glucosidase
LGCAQKRDGELAELAEGKCDFSFGYGFESPQVAEPIVKLGHVVTMEAQVSNTGNVAGDVVAQRYIHQRFGRRSRPIRERQGFERMSLEPHPKKTVRFVLTPEDLTYWSTAKRGWTRKASLFDSYVGEGSAASSAGTFTVTQ